QIAGGSGGLVPAPANRTETCIKGVHPICADDFERYTVGQKPPLPFNVGVSAGNRLVVANDKHVSGTKSIRIDTVPGESPYATMGLGLSQVFLGGKKKFFARMMLWMGGLPGGSSGENTHWSLVGFQNVFTGGNAGVSFGGYAEQGRRLLYYGT